MLRISSSFLSTCYLLPAFANSLLYGKVAVYKSQLFDKLRGQAKEVLEIGIGTGPNLKYYASDASMVFGIDPNKKMEKYARGAADAAGLSPENFKFVQAVSFYTCRYISHAVRSVPNLLYFQFWTLKKR